MANVRIAVVDDHEIVRDGIQILLEDEPGFEIVGKLKPGKKPLNFVSPIKSIL